MKVYLLKKTIFHLINKKARKKLALLAVEYAKALPTPPPHSPAVTNKKVIFLMAVRMRAGEIKGLPIRKKHFFGTFFCWKTCWKSFDCHYAREGGRREGIMHFNTACSSNAFPGKCAAVRTLRSKHPPSSSGRPITTFKSQTNIWNFADF